MNHDAHVLAYRLLKLHESRIKNSGDSHDNYLDRFVWAWIRDEIDLRKGVG